MATRGADGVLKARRAKRSICCGLLLAAAHSFRGGFLRLAAVLGGLGWCPDVPSLSANASAYEYGGAGAALSVSEAKNRVLEVRGS